jgi:porin
MYDLSRYGIPDGQFVLGGVASQTTWDGAFPSFLSMNQLSYYQTFADKKLEFNIGYIPFLYQFVGPLVGGNIFNVLGPAATIPVLMGASSGSGGSPSVILNWHITDRFYDKAAVIRSDPTTSVNNTDHLTAIQIADYTNPTNFKFADAPYWNGVQYPAERALFVNEVGYKNAAAPGDPFTWIRVTGMYNTTKFENYQNPTQQTTNAAILGYADRQIWQSEPGDKTTAYRGVYVGGTASWASPQATAITQDYQFRLYELGMFGRPKDQLSFIWERTVYSPYIVNPINSSALCSAGALCAQNYTNQFSLTYNVNVMPGIYTGIGVAYIDHPALTYSPNAGAYGAAAAPVFPQYNINHAVNFLASLFINL